MKLLCDRRRKRFWFTAYIGSILIFSSAYCLLEEYLCFNQDLSGIEPLYFSVVTQTTLGYGEIHPKGPLGQLLTIFQVGIGIFVLGGFLNALANTPQRKRIESIKHSLTKHCSLLLDGLKSPGIFKWDKHAVHAPEIEEIEAWMRKTHQSIDKKPSHLDQFAVAMFLQVCDQNRETMTALAPVAAEVSGEYALHWASIVSNVLNLSDQYRNYTEVNRAIIRDLTPEQKALYAAGSKDLGITSPTAEDIALQVQEMIESTLFLAGKAPVL